MSASATHGGHKKVDVSITGTMSSRFCNGTERHEIPAKTSIGVLY